MNKSFSSLSNEGTFMINLILQSLGNIKTTHLEVHEESGAVESAQ